MLLLRDYASENLDYARFYASYAFMLKLPKNANYAQNSASRRNQSLLSSLHVLDGCVVSTA